MRAYRSVVVSRREPPAPAMSTTAGDADGGAFDPLVLAGPPFSYLHPRFVRCLQRLSSFPSPEEYDELAAQVPRASNVEVPRFVSQHREAVKQAGGYEQHVARHRAVPTRPGSWHDFFNMVVWAHFPALRWALNSLHVEPGAAPRDPRNGRAPAQNLAASFDETGMLVVSRSRSVLEGLRGLHFKRVFWEQRAELAPTTRFFIVGHGLLESLLSPHPRLLARSSFIHLPESTALDDDELRQRCDAWVAAKIQGWRQEKPLFDPIPVCAIPGFADNESAAFYDDRQRLPFDPVSRRPGPPVPFDALES